ncbi:hypothetical protein GFL54_34910 [Rhizobium laguerreae]|uniref:hypothetical protein n=1 Tax=Rhizobium laguerreae TaxID=1076926 RepID=UPI00143FB539|nr:hypothetical protein [Rhizobium laguerreae]NKM89311.1 hypothetical protein [Rhizobium laguerreae]
MSIQALFAGIAIVIDDEFGDEQSQISVIAKAIQDGGGHVVGLKALPQEKAQIAHYSGASFFILDWNLRGTQAVLDVEYAETVSIPSSLSDDDLIAKVEFLLSLRDTRLAPVFIFTADNVEKVKDQLKKHPSLYKSEYESHIFVMSKQDVIDKGVFCVLEDFLKTNPSALALKQWEKDYETAKNQLFLDFYIRSPMWPAILWKTFKDDDLAASDELGRLISRNLISRMLPIKIDMEPFMSKLNDAIQAKPDDYRNTLLSVLEGERFIKNERLDAESIAPGDVFADGSTYWINIRPDCDCISRDGGDITLYCLKGKKLTDKEVADRLPRPEKGVFSERDDEAIVFGMRDAKSFTFKLKELHHKGWAEMRTKRVGRLIPPFSTRVQQRYSSYLQRPGLPRIPMEAMPQRVLDSITPNQRAVVNS